MSSTPEAPATFVPERKMPPPTPVSFEEFHDWLDEDTWAEWVDGEIIFLSPSNVEHLDLIGFLYELLMSHVRSHGLGRLFMSGLLMRLRTRPSGREPDLVFVANEHLDRLRDTYLDGPADLAVEVVSPDSDDHDRREKLAEYETAHIREYWVVDPRRREALFYRLGPNGRYQLVPVDVAGVYESAVLAGFRLRVAWLWERPLPTPADVVRQIEA